MTVAMIRATGPHDHPVDSAPVHRNATVGLFIALVWEKGSMALHLEKPAPAEYELEFV
jgi:hypothetical protein